MELTKAQRNANPIKRINEVRERLHKLINDLETGDGSDEAKQIVIALYHADGMAIARLRNLGLSIKLVDSKERE